MKKQVWKGYSNVTWNEIEMLVGILTDKIKKTCLEFDKITTISRGGLVPARLVADHFNIKKIIVNPKKILKKTLFIDDIFDSGDTFNEIFLHVLEPENFLYATLFARKGMKYPKQLVYAKKTQGSEYVIFPWDKLEFERIKKKIKY